ncbi:alpha/beta hydrolase [Pseudoflavonifractor sp. 524-17]|uniref:alpha/beta hydrolase n=1 Tax=Pseudoflavonifractor sp. 524-17 TaxID=2304577 RepID=UPI001FABDEE9|nr:alpha/beta hydrolase [Pseudoflavonifractor sp. 524-17]
MTKADFTEDTPIADVMSDPAFEDFGRLLFPVQSSYYSGDTLGELRLSYYSHIDPEETVEIVNTLKENALAGETVFYDIYTEEEKAADPAKEDTGLFFFRGEPDAPFAVCNAGGAFAYVGAMHDSFPHALELSKKGYNAFALIYRPSAQSACEDLARAISFIFANAEEPGVSTDCYSLWGGSAGGRMTAYLSSYGPATFGGDDLPLPGTAVIQYTGHTDYSGQEPPTFVCVGDSDGIASWRTMERRQNALSALGIETAFHVHEGLGHGSSLGTGTAAEDWLDEAAAFWQKQIDKSAFVNQQGLYPPEIQCFQGI